MRDFFEKVMVISLDNAEGERRRGLLTKHLKEVGWPFKEPEFFRAVHGDTVGWPDWWKVGGGAWGCYRSHLAVIERCLNGGDSPVLILEDDVIFLDGFADRVKDYLEHLPDDWGMAYLGGQHLWEGSHPPRAVNEHVTVPFNVNRTHAYALRGQDFMRKIYRWLLELPVFSEEEERQRPLGWHMWRRDGDDLHHIDHRYGRFAETNPGGVYAPTMWLAGQRGGASDVAGCAVTERWWDERSASGGKIKDLAIVLGLHNSGSTVIARMLHELGVYFGDDLGAGPWGVAYEEPTLRNLCEEAVRFPFVGDAPGHAWACERLQKWIETHRYRGGGSPMVGIKFPLLCRVLPQLNSLPHNNLRIINCNRDLEKSIAGLQRRMRDAYPQSMLADHQRFLHDAKQNFLATTTFPILDVDFNELVHAPQHHLHELAAFLNLPIPDDARTEAICREIDPQQCHF